METAKGTSFLQSLAIQMRVIGALVTRDMLTSHGRRDIGFLWLVVSPMLFTVVISSMSALRGSSASFSNQAITISVTGFSFLNMLRGIPTSCAGAVNANRRLLLHRHIRIMDLFFARLILEFGIVTISFIVLGTACIFFGLIAPPADILEAVIAWVLLAWFACSVGLVGGPVLLKFPVLKNFMLIFSIGCMVMSGALTPVGILPDKIQQLLLFIPTVHGMEMLREGFLGPLIHAQYDISYMVYWSLCLTFIGLAFARTSHVEVENR